MGLGRHWKWLPIVALAGCGVATVSVSQQSDDERVAEIEHGLGAKLKATFGDTARVARVVDEKQGVVVSVALEPAPIDGDDLPPVALAHYEPKSDTLTVIAKDATFKEGRIWGDKAALVSQDGALQLGDTVVAQNVKGDLAVAADESKMALTMALPEDEGETSVAVVNTKGELIKIADAEGIDDRPSISPDGKTVVFVSGRTGITSFFRTTLDGAPAVQLTNVNVKAPEVIENATTVDAVIDEGANEEGDEPVPAGFVPTPVHSSRMWWVDADTLRYDAGEGEFWRLNIRTGVATREAK